MSAVKEHQDVIIIVLILMKAIIVLAWMDMNWNQIITLVQVIYLCTYIANYVLNTYVHIHSACVLST